DRRGVDEERAGQHGVPEAEHGQEEGPRGVAPPDGREDGAQGGKEDEQEGRHSRSTVSLRVSRESKARWMRSTMIPITNTPTVRSRSTPASTSRGMDSIRRRPNR